MVYTINLPSKPKIISENGNVGVFEIDSLHPGYGVTIGNSLRRILLSSLPGAAVTSVKIDGVAHEFSTLPGVLEDVITILLNLKQLRFKLLADEPQRVELTAKGAKELKAKDITLPSTVEIVNPQMHILTLTSKDAHVSLELIVERGLGYMPRELARKEKVEVGMMTLDAFFSPIQKVDYEVENMRVGDRTDYNRVRFTIETDGSIAPRDAFLDAVRIIMSQFEALSRGFYTEADREELKIASEVLPDESSVNAEGEDETDLGKLRVEDLRLSSRTINALHEAGIKTVSGLLRKDTETLSTIPGVGEKALQEIKRALGSMGLILN